MEKNLKKKAFCFFQTQTMSTLVHWLYTMTNHSFAINKHCYVAQLPPLNKWSQQLLKYMLPFHYCAMKYILLERIFKFHFTQNICQMKPHISYYLVFLFYIISNVPLVIFIL